MIISRRFLLKGPIIVRSGCLKLYLHLSNMLRKLGLLGKEKCLGNRSSPYEKV